MSYRYDVALSFAGENRQFAEAVAIALKEKGVRVFYDEFQGPDLWGKDLSIISREVYWKYSRYCIMILSAPYIEKEWTKLELRNAIERLIKQEDEYILPVRLDGFSGEVPGLPGTIKYLEAGSCEPEKVVNYFLDKFSLPNTRRSSEHFQKDIKELLMSISDIEETSSKESAGKIKSLATNLAKDLLKYNPSSDYLVEEPRESKRKYEPKKEKTLSSDAGITRPDPRFPTELVDREIEEEVATLRKSRFFTEFDSVDYSLKLAKKIAEGEFSGGTNIVRSRALAWCVRVFSKEKELSGETEKYLAVAKELGIHEETGITEAFVISREGNKEKALDILAGTDSPATRSAAFMVVAFHDGWRKAMDWLISAGLSTKDLDFNGKYHHLDGRLKLSDWDDARKCVDALTDEDMSEAPLLHYLTATTHLLTAVPDEFRTALRWRPPFEEVEFTLASDENSVSERRKAREHFLKAHEAAMDLDCSEAGKTFEEYALWLDASDPDKSDEGKKRLKEKLHDLKSSLHLVRLGIHCEMDLDPYAVEREIERQTVLHGKITRDAAYARFALLFTKNDLEDMGNYLDRYQNEIAGYFNKSYVQALKIKMFCESGLLDKARKCFAAVSKEETTEAFYEEIRKTVEEVQVGAAIEAQKKLFQETASLKDLMLLVNELRERGMWKELCEYARKLFEETRSLHDAEGLANAFCKTKKTDRLVKFSEANPEMLKRSKYLSMVYCWALYSEGSLLEARSRFKKLDCDHGDRHYRNYRALRVNLAVAMGDWNELSAFVADELSEKNDMDARELISVAMLAWHLGLASSKELALAAVEKGGEDPHVLGAAYFLALKADWKEDSKVKPHSWLEKSLSLSGDGGPIHLVSFGDLAGRSSEWRKRQSDTMQQLTRGEIPMFAAAVSLNRPLVDFTLLPALLNMQEEDIRRRCVIPAYSGSRRPGRVDTERTVGIDATALITLSFLNLLDKALDAFETVYVPHSTLAWLLDEKRKILPHQPSRTVAAGKLRKLLSDGLLEEIPPEAVPDDSLLPLVGEDLAVMIAEAEKKMDGGGGGQRIVISTYPVYETASMMEKEADLTAHARVTGGCRPVIDKLLQNGRITAEAAGRASSYLNLHEKPWPNQPEIADGATLYLDYAVATYFLELGILEKLQPSGFRPIVSRTTVFEMNEILSREDVSGDVEEAIENIRYALNSRIESGKVKVARRLDAGDPANQFLYEQTAGVPSLAVCCDAIIADDRFFNQHTMVFNAEEKASVFSTLDLLESLASSGSITSQQKLEYRTRLRDAGYLFVPVSEDETGHLLGHLSIGNDKTVERPELAAIRKNVLCAQVNNEWLQLPKEWGWAYLSLTALVRATKALWTAESDPDIARARSEWLLDRFNIEGWIQELFRKNKEDATVREIFGLQVLTMIRPLTDVPQDVGDAYWNWLGNRILVPLKEEYPDSYSWIIEFYKKEISKCTDRYLNEAGGQYDKTTLGAEAALCLPPPLRDSLLADSFFRTEYGLKADPAVFFEYYSVSFRRSELFGTIVKVLSGTSDQEVTDEEGRKWKMRNESGEDRLPNLHLFRESEKFSISPEFVCLSPETGTRLRFLEEISSQLNLPAVAKDAWHEILVKRSLEGDEVERLSKDFLHTPVAVMRSMSNGIEGRNPASLVPASQKYFDRLVGEYDGSADIRDYAAGKVRTFFKRLSDWNPYEGFLMSLLLSSHPALTDEIDTDKLSTEELVRAYDFLEKRGDRTSQLGGIEIGLRILPSNPGVEPFLVRLVKQMLNDDIAGKTSGFRLLSALFLLSDGQMSRTRVLSLEPPFYRRLAALSHATLIHRQLVNSNLDSQAFYMWTFANHGGQYYLQSLVDMRMEPHWSPVFGTATYIKKNFYSRIAHAVKKYEQNIGKGELAELVSGIELESTCHPCSPGPLEGTMGCGRDLPAEVYDSLETQIATRKVSASSFDGLGNSVRKFRLGTEHAELVVRALKSCNYRLTGVKSKVEFSMTLSRLAGVATVTRNSALADELRKVVRVHRGKAQPAVSMEDAIMICLKAAASRENLDDWTEFVGDWVTELAFGDLEDGEEHSLRTQLRYLCLISPGLWTSCAKAYAALASHDGRTQRTGTLSP